MNRLCPALRGIAAYTLVEMMMSTGVIGLVMAGLVTGSVMLQKTFYAIKDYSTAEADQLRISDYLAVDMRRAIDITPDNSGGVTVVLPNYYNSDGTPRTPSVVENLGWPQMTKKRKRNKHKNIIVSSKATYDPASTQTVKYYKGNAGSVGTDPSVVYRETNGIAKAIATDVADFNINISEDETFARTQISFTPRYSFLSRSEAYAGTTYYQTTFLRNLQ